MNESAACVRRAVLVVKIFLYMGQDQSVSPRLDQSLLADQHSDPKTPSPKQAVTYISLQCTLLTFRFGVRPDTLLNWMDGFHIAVRHIYPCCASKVDRRHSRTYVVRSVRVWRAQTMPTQDFAGH